MAVRLPPIPTSTPASRNAAATGHQIFSKPITRSSCSVSDSAMPVAMALYKSHCRPKPMTAKSSFSFI